SGRVRGRGGAGRPPAPRQWLQCPGRPGYEGQASSSIVFSLSYNDRDGPKSENPRGDGMASKRAGVSDVARNAWNVTGCNGLPLCVSSSLPIRLDLEERWAVPTLHF